MTRHGETLAGHTADGDNRTEPQHLESREPGKKFTTEDKTSKNQTETPTDDGSDKYGDGPDGPGTGDARSNSERGATFPQPRIHSPPHRSTSNKTVGARVKQGMPQSQSSQYNIQNKEYLPRKIETINTTKEMFPERNIGMGCTRGVDLLQDSMDGKYETKPRDDIEENTQSSLKRPETHRAWTTQERKHNKYKMKDAQISQWMIIIAAYVVTHAYATGLTREPRAEETIHHIHATATPNLIQNKLAKTPPPHDPHTADTGRHPNTPRRFKPVTPEPPVGETRASNTPNTGASADKNGGEQLIGQPDSPGVPMLRTNGPAPPKPSTHRHVTSTRSARRMEAKPTPSNTCPDRAAMGHAMDIIGLSTLA